MFKGLQFYVFKDFTLFLQIEGTFLLLEYELVSFISYCKYVRIVLCRNDVLWI